MIEKCNGDLTKEKNIKKNQLFGIEYQPEIYPLTVSNMLLHGDGKSNIISGNCFDENIIKTIKTIKPTVGFLNPPYKATKTKKSDLEEFEFVLNSLSCLKEHSLCVVIIPMSCFIIPKLEQIPVLWFLKRIFVILDEKIHFLDILRMMVLAKEKQKVGLIIIKLGKKLKMNGWIYI